MENNITGIFSFLESQTKTINVLQCINFYLIVIILLAKYMSFVDFLYNFNFVITSLQIVIKIQVRSIQSQAHSSHESLSLESTISFLPPFIFTFLPCERKILFPLSALKLSKYHGTQLGNGSSFQLHASRAAPLSIRTCNRRNNATTLLINTPIITDTCL